MSTSRADLARLLRQGEEKMFVLLAGYRAERHKHRSWPEWRTAYHEAGHVVAARIVGHWIGGAAIHSRGSGNLITVGHVVTTPEPGSPEVTDSTPRRSDNAKIARIAKSILELTGRRPTWRAIREFIRAYQWQADRLLVIHAASVARVAQALIHRGTLNEQEIAELLHDMP